ncbi:hypothetical protein I307_05675 [Cryptococcus deuterogattii 99/473]|uniref:Amidohydrolase-related domain-containing protein n=1 Tax=Cryptococcus deuterogattii Ram5 TaxID=1296110 RepID=A0A0D0UWP1_9TREE|nr:hypothetical protein I309_06560 [Cryptococcus deuterogattii LA55]KIR38549.1 hypothetical protein I313_05661 [Cryptococcus deuterogattii Ram5]KIR90258.1 hypothetical protein I304_05834 [Cryptococcus deuterogattii CBS 10090]KIY55023.1 hypothetical protein I307_05675 [Cryptococcus deuterogattii 99/473]
MANHISSRAPRQFRPLEENHTRPWYTGPADPVCYTNAIIIDTEKGVLVQNGDRLSVLVENGIITSISSQPDSSKDIEVVDLGGLFLCPGLIDTHVHVCAVPGGLNHKEMARTPSEVVTLRTTHVLKTMLERGFTTARDVGGASKNIANAVSEGLLSGPRLFQCGRALSQTGGHGDFVKPDNQAHCCGGHSNENLLGRLCDGVPECLKAVRTEIKAGADHIKVMVGGGVATEADGVETVQFTGAEIRAITETCDLMGGIHTTAHAYTDRAIRHAVENGIKGIEHGNLMSAETAKYMAERGIFYTPTLATSHVWNRHPYNKMLPPANLEKNNSVMHAGLRAAKFAYDAGVIMCYGSDMLGSKQVLQTEEFAVLATVLPDAHILKMATINSAKVLKQEGKLGVIAPGAHGDMLVLSENPLEDITVLDQHERVLKGVIQGGRRKLWRL